MENEQILMADGADEQGVPVTDTPVADGENAGDDTAAPAADADESTDAATEAPAQETPAEGEAQA